MNGPDRARFMAKVKVNEATGCWEWTAAVAKFDGRGRFSLDGQPEYAHRAAWILFVGPIPDGQQVLHHCDNPSCVNYTKCLFLGTQLENIADRHAKGRSRGASLPGELSPHAKITWDIARKIRASNETQEVLAYRYGVGQTRVSQIKRNKTWKIEDDPG